MPRPLHSSPSWPAYLPEPRDYPQRTLVAILPGGRFVSEHGETATPATWQDVADFLFSVNGLAWVDHFEQWIYPWLPEILRELGKTPGTRLHVAPNTSRLVSVSITRKWPNRRGIPQQQTRHIASAASWPGGVANAEFLRLLRTLFDACGAGTRATPAALGLALMQHEWVTTGKRPQYMRPSLDCIDALSHHAIGARKEAFAPDRVFDLAYELDKTNGYASHSLLVPAGTTGFCSRGYRVLDRAGEFVMPPYMRACWAKVKIEIRPPGLKPRDIAPFAVRDGRGNLSWPTTPGHYESWLWHFEIEELFRRRAFGEQFGYLGIEETYYWPHADDCLAGWARRMDRMRREFSDQETADGAILAGFIKAATVAGIGRLGMPYLSSDVIHERDSTADDEPLQSDVFPDSVLWIHQTAISDAAHPMHWHRYILACQNFDIYLAARREFLRGKTNLIAINVDAIYLDGEPDGGVEPKAAQLGDYKRKVHHVYFSTPAPGVVLSTDKLATPGLSVAIRDRLMRQGETRSAKQEARAHARRQAADNTHAANAASIRALERVRGYYRRQAGTYGRLATEQG